MSTLPTSPANPPLVSPQIPAQKKRWSLERVEALRAWTPSLWSISVSRPADYSFTPGHYARLGLPADAGDAAWRAYSIVSAPSEALLEFLVTLIPGGAFTSQLAAGGRGANVMVEAGAMGFFIESQLSPGETLWMLATGSGVGPYVSMLRDGAVWARYRKIVLVHCVRQAAELAYAEELRRVESARAGAFQYMPIATREPGSTVLSERVPPLIESGALEAAVGEPLDVSTARVMVCGNPDFTGDMRRLLVARKFQPCRRGLVGSMVFENYW